jgi:hypothetical protein
MASAARSAWPRPSNTRVLVSLYKSCFNNRNAVVQISSMNIHRLCTLQTKTQLHLKHIEHLRKASWLFSDTHSYFIGCVHAARICRLCQRHVSSPSPHPPRRPRFDKWTAFAFKGLSGHNGKASRTEVDVEDGVSSREQYCTDAESRHILLRLRHRLQATEGTALPPCSAGFVIST